MIADHVGAQYPDGFGSKRIAGAQGVSLAAVTNTAATLAVTEGTKYIIRRITVANANTSVTSANIAICTSNDGNASNLVAANTALSNISSNSTWQDLTLAAGAATNVYSAGAMFVIVNSGGNVAATVDIAVYGDVVAL